MTPRASRVLLVDDDATQLKLGRLRLADAGFTVDTASDAEAALEKARSVRPDVVMTDVVMGEVDGFTLCHRIKDDASLASVPVVLLSAHYRGTPEQELAERVGAAVLVARTPTFDAELDALRAALGAKDPVAHRAGPEAPDVALYEQHLRTAANQVTQLAGRARSAEERFRALFENANDAISVLTPDGVILETNARWNAIMGVGPDEIVGRHISDYAPPGHVATNLLRFHRSIAKGAGRDESVAIQRPDGRCIFMEFSNTLVEVEGGPLVFTIGHDVTEKILAAKTLAEAEERYRTLVERIPEVIWTFTADLKLTFLTANVERVVGHTAEEMLALSPEERIARVHPDDRAVAVAALRGFVTRGEHFDIEHRHQRRDGQWIWVRNRAVATYERDDVRYFDCMISDVTERRRLEESVRQSQKMEAIGQLTGGIAHDFNNVLSAILANSHFLLEDLAEHDPRRADANEIKIAAERAAALTRQLLAFSRRQILEPKLVNLNDAVGGLERMLRRLIGEDVEFTVVRGANVGTVRVDVGQLEQVIMNLAVNARDAMPTGGAMTIETSSTVLEDADVARHASAIPGSYAVLTVKDSGHGMDAGTMRRIFEPFFTTKEVGKGTGLGLATCYGIVKQSGGFICVESEPGRGSTFRVHLPRVGERADADASSAPRLDFGGTETILLIEDDDRVRAAVTRMLEARRYRILSARDGVEALEIAAAHGDDIDLVVSDVIMPGASGPEVVERLRERVPDLRSLLISGYTDHPLLDTCAFQSGLDFLQKPFTPQTLAMKVRKALDAR